MSAFKSNAGTPAARDMAFIKQNVLLLAQNANIVSAGKNNQAGYMELYEVDDPVSEDVTTAIGELDTDGAIDLSAGDFTANGNTPTHLAKWTRREKLLNASIDTVMTNKRSIDEIEETYGVLGYARATWETELNDIKTEGAMSDADQVWPGNELPMHPTTTPSENLFEYEYLFDGTNATMNYVEDGTSTWVFPPSTLKPDDVDQAGMKIKLAKTKFGAAPLPTPPGSRFIEIDANFIWMKVWLVTSVQVDGGGNVTVSLDIPGPPPPP